MPEPDWARIRALTDGLRRWDAMTDEERAEAAKPTKRQQVLGSLDDTHALNRSEGAR